MKTDSNVIFTMAETEQNFILFHLNGEGSMKFKKWKLIKIDRLINKMFRVYLINPIFKKNGIPSSVFQFVKIENRKEIL